MPSPAILIPDDYPVIMAASGAYRRFAESTPVAYHDTLPGSEAALIERIRDFEIVINIRSSSKFSAGVFAACPRLKLLSLWGTGTDNVDLAAAARHKVAVTNTPGVSAPSIAEHALMLTLAVARRVVASHNGVVAGQWPRGQAMQLQGKTLGIVGLGAIGRRFATLAQGIGMKVLAWTMHPNPALGFELVELDALLRARRIAGAGLDVFDVEPLPPGHPLTKLDNVVLTPHSAGITPEVLEAGLALAIENVRSFLSGAPRNVVAAK